MNKDLKKFVKDFKQKALNHMKEEVAFEIQRHYDLFIEQFYNEYDPLYYQRTLSTYEASSASNSFLDAIIDMDNVGIYVSSDYISGNPYGEMNKEEVFYNVYDKGLHGKVGAVSDYKASVAMNAWFQDFKANKKTKDTPTLDEIKKKSFLYALRK